MLGSRGARGYEPSMRIRRSQEDVTLAFDLARRLEVYTRDAGVHCHGCGTWLAHDESSVRHWGYDRRGDPMRTYPFCDRCARLGLITHR
jgi:hypothetical protein